MVYWIYLNILMLGNMCIGFPLHRFVAQRLCQNPSLFSTDIQYTLQSDLASPNVKKIDELVQKSTFSQNTSSVMLEFTSQRHSLWKQTHGTIIFRVLKKEVLMSIFWTLCAMNILNDTRLFRVLNFERIEYVWMLGQTFTSFMLSFFVQQSYQVWLDVYSSCRKIQGRLNDIGLLISIHADRTCHGAYTFESQQIGQRVARYSRLFHLLFYASISKKYALFSSQNGYDGLQILFNETDMLTLDEYEILKTHENRHQIVLVWIGICIKNSIQDGHITGGNLISFQFSEILTTLRSQYAQMGDILSGRMSFAYIHLAQLFSDILCITAPFALMKRMGIYGTLAATSFITLFQNSVLNLAKVFLDPFGNESLVDHSGLYLEITALNQEVNAATQRWIEHTQEIPA